MGIRSQKSSLILWTQDSDFGTICSKMYFLVLVPIQTLPSKYFYDAKGDKLFQQIMALPDTTWLEKIRNLRKATWRILKPIF